MSASRNVHYCTFWRLKIIEVTSLFEYDQNIITILRHFAQYIKSLDKSVPLFHFHVILNNIFYCDILK